jgi:hypothetical protein
VLQFADPDAVWSSQESDKILNSVALTISEVVGMPTSYVTARFAESRRLKAATRQLSTGVLAVEYSIHVPADSAATVPDAGAVEASLDSVDVIIFTSLLQRFIDSSVGEDVYSIQVLAITSRVDGAPDAVPEGFDDTEGLPSFFIIVGVGCCVGFEFPIMALCWRARIRRTKLQAPREESDQDESVPKSEEHDLAQSGHPEHGRAVKDSKLPEAPDQPTREHDRVAPAIPLIWLAMRTVVELQGFQTKPHLNGLRGRVIEWMPALGRYVVELDDGRRKSIGPVNLLPVEAANTDDVRLNVISPQPPMAQTTRRAAVPLPADGFLDFTRPRMVQPRSVMPPLFDDVNAIRPMVPHSSSCHVTLV